MNVRIRIVAALAVLLLLASCARHAEKASTLTEHQRDSILATEPIPGASAIKGAFRAADKEAAHAAMMDTMVH
jgi:hypothetical protein